MQTDAVKAAQKMHLMLYTAISELKVGLFVIHSVQTELCRSDARRG